MNYCGAVSPAYHTSTCHQFKCRPLCIFYPGIFIKIAPAFIPTNTAFLVPTPPANHLSPKPGDRPATSPMTGAGLLVQSSAPVCLSVCPVCLLGAQLDRKLLHGATLAERTSSGALSGAPPCSHSRWWWD